MYREKRVDRYALSAIVEGGGGCLRLWNLVEEIYCAVATYNEFNAGHGTVMAVLVIIYLLLPAGTASLNTTLISTISYKSTKWRYTKHETIHDTLI